MKKFDFTLQKLYDVKTMREDEAKATLERIVKKRDALEGRLNDTLRQYREERTRYEIACREGITGAKLREYSAQFEYLIDAQRELDGKIAIENERIDVCRAQIVTLMNEKKVLDRMKDEQKLDYEKEVARDGEKSIEDFMNAQVRSGV